MSLYEKLQIASSEEDVKDAYIKALGSEEYQNEKWRCDFFSSQKNDYDLGQICEKITTHGLWTRFFKSIVYLIL